MNLKEYITQKNRVEITNREENAEFNQENQYNEPSSDSVEPNDSNNMNPNSNYNSNQNTDMNQAYQKYGNMSEENLMQELFSVANKERAEGKIDNSALDNFYNQSSAYFTPEQQAKMKDLISMLKQ